MLLAALLFSLYRPRSARSLAFSRSPLAAHPRFPSAIHRAKSLAEHQRLCVALSRVHDKIDTMYQRQTTKSLPSLSESPDSNRARRDIIIIARPRLFNLLVRVNLSLTFVQQLRAVVRNSAAKSASDLKQLFDKVRK